MAANSLALQVGVAPACRGLGVPRATFLPSSQVHSRAPAAPPAPGSARGTNENASWRRCPRRASSTAPRPRSSRRFSTKGTTFARNARCIGFWLRANRCANDEISSLTPATPSPSWSRPHRTKPGRGISRAFWDRNAGRTFTCTGLLDIFSRYVVGWMVAERESSALAARLIEQTCLKQGIEPQNADPAFGSRRTDDEQVHRAVAGRPLGDVTRVLIPSFSGLWFGSRMNTRISKLWAS